MTKFNFLVLSTLLILQSSLQAQKTPNVNNLRSIQLIDKFKSASFLNDMEVVESQRKRITEIQANCKEKIRSIPKSKPGTNTRFKAMEATTAESLHKIFYEVLLPHQQVRFVQLVHQSEISRNGGSLSRYIVGKHIGKEIGLTSQQTKELKVLQAKKLDEIRAAAIEFRNQVGAILAAENKETMTLLNDNERKIVTELIGERNVVLVPGAEAAIYFDQAIRPK